MRKYIFLFHFIYFLITNNVSYSQIKLSINIRIDSEEVCLIDGSVTLKLIKADTIINEVKLKQNYFTIERFSDSVNLKFEFINYSFTIDGYSFKRLKQIEGFRIEVITSKLIPKLEEYLKKNATRVYKINEVKKGDGMVAIIEIVESDFFLKSCCDGF